MRKISLALLAWYQKNKRPLPWRDQSNPYWILLSEIMLQQTQVKTVIPYFERFLRRFPKIEDLANSTEEELLGLWAGLGYYRRAKSMHQTAKIIAQSGFPQNAVELKSLPGIGDYSSAAIASIAFSQAIPVVDGNVIRLLARFFALKGTYKSKILLDQVKIKATALMDSLKKEHPGDFNQAMMEMGALCCTPQNPNCDSCPINKQCQGKLTPVAFPQKENKKIFETWFRISLIITKNKKLYLSKRPEQAKWLKNMWGPIEKWFRNEKDLKKLLANMRSEFDFPHESLWKPIKKSSHTITKHKIKSFSFEIEMKDFKRGSAGKYFSQGQLAKLGIASLDKKILRNFEETKKGPPDKSDKPFFRGR